MKALFKEVLKSKIVKVCIIATILVGLLESIFNAYFTTLMTNVISNKVDQKKGLLLIIIICIIQMINAIARDILQHTAQYKSYTYCLQKLINKVLYCDYNVFTKYSTDTVHTIVGSITIFVESVTGTLQCVDSILFFCTTCGAIILIEKWFSIPILVTYGIGILIFSKFLKYIRKLDKKASDLKHERAAEIEKFIHGFNEVRSFSTEEEHLFKFNKINDILMDTYQVRRKLRAIYIQGLYEILDSILTIAVVAFAIIYIPKGYTTPTICMSIVMYMWRLTGPMMNTIGRLDEISEGYAEFEKYKQFIDIKDTIKDGNIKLSSFNNGIELDNISFGYTDSEMVIQNLSLYIKKGMKLGICGTSGEGKSTLIKLLPRFYDINAGFIKIDGIDIRELTLKSLRKLFGVVHQKGYIFKGTVLENLKYGNPNASETDIIEACKKASIYDFIKKLPEQLNTKLGPGALELSGGQSQRLCIARIFLQDPDIIILDEATSALDNESEQIIQDSLELFKDKTIITIAHRLSTIQNCDKIIVMNNHTIAEQGTHIELLKMNGIYSKLATKNIKNK